MRARSGVPFNGAFRSYSQVSLNNAVCSILWKSMIKRHCNGVPSYFFTGKRITINEVVLGDLSVRKQPRSFRDVTTGFHSELTSEERAQKFRTDDVSLPRCV